MEKIVDWYGKPYYSLDAYFKNKYGQKIYKIAVDAGLTCPNRDGTLGNSGCIFCSKGGSGEFAVHEKNTEAQIKEGLKKFRKSVGSKYVIYFQAFTNTYGDKDYLRGIWTDALECEAVVGISVATRPDCLGNDILMLLKEINDLYSTAQKGSKFVWVELGLQTIHKKTAEYIRRMYPLAVYEKAIADLDRIGIPYITHIILGLPGETKKDMLESVAYVGQGLYDCERRKQIAPFGIKLQLLHVLEGTDLAEEYRKGAFSVPEMDEYIDLLVEALRIIKQDIVIHRVTGDGKKSRLIAPLWSSDKKRVLNTLHKRMKEKGAVQGDNILHICSDNNT